MKKGPPRKTPVPLEQHRPGLPDFDLAPLMDFAPDALRVGEPLGSFVLLLAAIFNDLKGAA
jgi:hypothetical protein